MRICYKCLFLGVLKFSVFWQLYPGSHTFEHLIRASSALYITRVIYDNDCIMYNVCNIIIQSTQGRYTYDNTAAPPCEKRIRFEDIENIISVDMSHGNSQSMAKFCTIFFENVQNCYQYKQIIDY